MQSLIEQVDSLLPQTQCRQCGYDGCRPYAQALVEENVAINLCIPGQDAVMQSLANLLERETCKVAPRRFGIAYIDEWHCIGCTACIKACPVDAIIGTTKHMHTVIESECTACGLCAPPCPVDCIEFFPPTDELLPRNPYLGTGETLRSKTASHAKTRYLNKKDRLTTAKAKPTPTKASTTPKPSFDPTSLLARAKQTAKSKTQNGRTTVKDNEFYNKELQQAQERSARRRAERERRYGTTEQLK